ncbi:MAG: hypothetical protein PHN78_00530 [Dehalococcoidales bacterium]|nr:hypothetical protein [Dehalococcoidales bacterium]
MSGKSRHKRGKQSFQSKKKEQKSQPAIIAQQPTASQTREPGPQPKLTVPGSRVPATEIKSTAARFPYVTAELRAIGILAAAMLIVLVLISLVIV